MQSEATTPEEYLESLASDWRLETLQELRALLRSEAPEAVEGVEYGMLSYSYDSRRLFHLGAQSSYVSLYVGDARKVDPDGTLLSSVDLGKGCIRFRKSTRVGETGIQAFIAEAVRMAREGLDIDC